MKALMIDVVTTSASSSTLKLSGQSFYTCVVLATILDVRELKFLIRQIDEHIQVMECMIRLGCWRTRVGPEIRDEAKPRQTDRPNIGGRT